MVSAGTWPLIWAGVTAKYLAPADHLEVLNDFTSMGERDEPSGILASFGKKEVPETAVITSSSHITEGCWLGTPLGHQHAETMVPRRSGYI